MIEAERKIPECLRVRVDYLANGKIHMIFLEKYEAEEGSSRIVKGYHARDLEELTKQPKTAEESQRFFLHRNIRTLALGAEEAVLTWSATSQPRYRYRKASDEIYTCFIRDLNKDPSSIRTLQYVLKQMER